MDDIARGITTAALTLQSVLLQALVYKEVLTPTEALDLVDKSLEAIRAGSPGQAPDPVAQAAHDCLEGMREGITDLVN